MRRRHYRHLPQSTKKDKSPIISEESFKIPPTYTYKRYPNDLASTLVQYEPNADEKVIDENSTADNVVLDFFPHFQPKVSESLDSRYARLKPSLSNQKSPSSRRRNSKIHNSSLGMYNVVAADDSRKSSLHPYLTDDVPTQKSSRETPSVKVDMKKIIVSKKSEENKPSALLRAEVEMQVKALTESIIKLQQEIAALQAKLGS